MNPSDEWNDLDEMIARAMRARPELDLIPDLATQAIRRAAGEEALRQAADAKMWGLLVRQRRVARMATLAAAVLIGIVLWMGVRRWLEFSRTTVSDVLTSELATGSSTQSESAATGTSSSSSTYSTISVTLVGGCVLALVLVCLALERAFAVEGQMPSARQLRYCLYCAVG